MKRGGVMGEGWGKTVDPAKSLYDIIATLIATPHSIVMLTLILTLLTPRAPPAVFPVGTIVIFVAATGNVL